MILFMNVQIPAIHLHERVIKSRLQEVFCHVIVGIGSFRGVRNVEWLKGRGWTMRSKNLLSSQTALVALCALLFAICVPSLMAQSAGTSGLTGIITDPSGAAIPNVTVTLTSNDTGQTRTATTGGDGQYKFTLLPPGSYKVRFAAAGFKTSEVGSVTLNVTESPALDRTLEVGAAVRAGHRGSLRRNVADVEFNAGNGGRQHTGD